MKLIAFGDSFVEGLIKEPIENSVEDRAKINFVTQLASLNNSFTSFENYGERGSGNESIAYKVQKRLDQPTDNCFFLVCWTTPFRVGKYKKEFDRYETVLTSNIVNKNFVFETKMLMFGISHLLKLNNIPYAFINSFSPESYDGINYINSNYKRNTLFDIIAERYGNTSTPTDHETKVNHSFFDVPNSKFIAPCKHPTAIGHRLIAKTLDKYLKEYTL
jgi:hypothetical protein